jgi:sulfur carrier protein
MKSAAAQTVRLIVNGAALDAVAHTVAELVVEAGFAGQRVATALNGQFVAEQARTETTLKPGDKVEILTPRQGG